MTTVGFSEEKEIFSEFELKSESVRLSAFSNTPGREIEAELQFHLAALLRRADYMRQRKLLRDSQLT